MDIQQTIASGCYPRWPCYTVRTCDPQPPHYWNPVETSASPHTRVPSIQEQMGTDPISKLAAAIERLADAMGNSK